MKKLILLSLFLFDYLLGQAQAVTIKPGTFQYASIAGSSFNFEGDFSLSGPRAFYVAGSAGTLSATATIHLPNGAKIVEMTALYIDNSATQNMTFTLIRQGLSGGATIETLALTPSTSSILQNTTIAVSPAYTTNTSSEIYVVSVSLSSTSVTWPGSTLAIVGVIIKYQLE
jgi:hypothetical protein